MWKEEQHVSLRDRASGFRGESAVSTFDGLACVSRHLQTWMAQLRPRFSRKQLVIYVLKFILGCGLCCSSPPSLGLCSLGQGLVKKLLCTRNAAPHHQAPR